MDDWAVIRAEEPQKNSLSFLLLINEECLGALEEADHKLRFGIRYAKLKIFRSTGPVDDVDDVISTNKLLEDLAIDNTHI